MVVAIRVDVAVVFALRAFIGGGCKGGCGCRNILHAPRSAIIMGHREFSLKRGEVCAAQTGAVHAVIKMILSPPCFNSKIN